MSTTPMIQLLIQPAGVHLELPAGTPLSAALEQAGIDLAYPCGGVRLCGRCRVEFLRGAPEPTVEERRKLPYQDIASGIRLACCTHLHADAEIVVAAAETMRKEHVLNKGVRSDVVIDPDVKKFRCDLPPSVLGAPMSDWDRVVRSLADELRPEARPTLAVLQKLPEVVASASGAGEPVTLTMRANRVIEVECGDATGAHYGVAVDLGTTTLAAVLVDMNSGAELATAGCLNPQTSFGFDLISRIHAVQTDIANLDELHDRVVAAIGGLITDMCRQRGIPPHGVRAMALAGNTAMSHLFLRIDPRPLGVAPFAGTLRAGVRVEARDLRLPIHPAAPVYVLPCIGGFVGGDIVAGILLTKLNRQSGVSVLVDIGTNGEVVVARDGDLLATSSAAGPAFEGGKISCGLRATDGAVDHVGFDGTDMTLSTLGDKPARGVCGSGLIELFARCVEVGLVGMNGRVARPGVPETAGLTPALAARLDWDGAEPRIRVSDPNGNHETAWLTQSDIREFQLGKAAVQTAINMVLREAGVRPEGIDRFLVAGAFGNHLSIEDTMAIGVLPEMPRERVFFIGNSSLEGARCVLLNRYERRTAEQIAEMTGFVELASRPEFQEQFAMAMMLAPGMEM